VDALRAIDPYDAPTISRTFGRVAFGGGLIPPVSPRRLVPQGSAAIEVNMQDKEILENVQIRQLWTGRNE
jgi:hypothetical protein